MQRARALERLGCAVDHLPAWFFRRGTQLALDTGLASFSLWLAYQLRFDFAVGPQHSQVMWSWILALPLLRCGALWTLSAYNGIWRYFNMGDALAVLLGALPPSVLMLVLRLQFAQEQWLAALPLTVIVIEFGIFLVLALGVRGSRRLLYERSRREREQTRALVVGPEENLAGALRQVALLPNITVAGLLTPDPQIRGLRIGGFEVMDEPEALPARLAAGNIDLVLVADSDAEAIGKIMSTSMQFGVEARLLPPAATILNGDVRVSTTPKPELVVARRDEGALPSPEVIESFRGRAVLVTGAGGSIGSEICRQLARLPLARLVLVDQDENSIFEVHRELAHLSTASLAPLVADIRDRERIRTIFQAYRPAAVLHAAAYKHVPIMENNCSEAVLNNVLGTKVLAEAAITFRAERFVMISTDKAVNPTSIMGASKRVAELLLQSLADAQPRNGHGPRTRCACVRFANVLGSRGSVVPLCLDQIANGGPVTITDAEMTRYFMTIPEAVRLVLQAASLASAAEVYTLETGDPMKITDLARRLIEMSGLRPGEDIAIQYVGARPGEKTHEQLWTEKAKVEPTRFARVLRIQPPPLANDFPDKLAALEQAAWGHNDELVRRLMAAMPINYRQLSAQAAGD